MNYDGILANNLMNFAWFGMIHELLRELSGNLEHEK